MSTPSTDQWGWGPTKLRPSMTISLDGYVACPDQSLESPLVCRPQLMS
jgi:hypothetical protein